MINTQQTLNEFFDKCRQSGLSVTPQRLAVYKELINDETHPNPESVYKAIKMEYPTISLATVYKTLETFEKHGIVSVVTPLHETVRYDAKTHHHHHIVCVRCKKVMDIEDEGLEQLAIPKKVLIENKFLDYTIQFNVICSECRKEQN